MKTTSAAKDGASLSFPLCVEDFTTRWFQRAMASAFPDHRLGSCELVQRIGGTASKYRFRLQWEELDHSDHPPAHIWAKGGFELGGVDQGDAFINEAYFYRDIAKTLGINLPTCFFAAVDPRSRNGLILLEDLIDRGARFGSATRPLSLDEAAACLQMQARYHADYWNDRRLASHLWLKAGGSITSSGMVGQYFAAFWESSQELPRFQWTPAALRDRAKMEAALSSMVAEDARSAFCLVHGDSHCANLFFDRNGAPGYLDWQHVMRGHWAFDVCNLLVTGLTVEDRRTHDRALLADYRRALTAYGADAPSEAALWRDYRAHAVWSFMWVMCPTSAHAEEICSVNAERACAAIVELESLSLY